MLKLSRCLKELKINSWPFRGLCKKLDIVIHKERCRFFIEEEDFLKVKVIVEAKRREKSRTDIISVTKCGLSIRKRPEAIRKLCGELGIELIKHDHRRYVTFDDFDKIKQHYGVIVDINERVIKRRVSSNKSIAERLEIARKLKEKHESILDSELL